MKARLIVATGIAALGLSTAPALAGDEEDNLIYYSGKVERDDNTFFSMEIKKNNVNRRKVIKRVSAGIGYYCDDGASDRQNHRLDGRIRVLNNNRFRGTMSEAVGVDRSRGVVSPGAIVEYKIAGTLLSGGNARGTIDAEITDEDGGGSMDRLRGAGWPGSDEVRCYSGKLDWKAKRGARP